MSAMDHSARLQQAASDPVTHEAGGAAPSMDALVQRFEAVLNGPPPAGLSDWEGSASKDNFFVRELMRQQDQCKAILQDVARFRDEVSGMSLAEVTARSVALHQRTSLQQSEQAMTLGVARSVKSSLSTLIKNQ